MRGLGRRLLARLIARLPPPWAMRRRPSAAISPLWRGRGRGGLAASRLLLLLDQPAWAVWLSTAPYGPVRVERLLVEGDARRRAGHRGVGVVPHLGTWWGAAEDRTGALVAYERARDLGGQGADAATRASVIALLELARVRDARCRLDDVSGPCDDLEALVREAELVASERLDQSTVSEVIRPLDRHLTTVGTPPRPLLHRLWTLQLLAGQQDDAAQTAHRLGDAGTSLLTSWARLTSECRFRDAHDLKRNFAVRRAAAGPSRTAPMTDYVEHVQAAHYAHGPEAARARATKARPWCASPTERLVLEKLTADAELLIGDPDRLRAIRRRKPTVNAVAETAFADAIQGRRVIVVGPSPTVSPTASQIADADVVATTVPGLEVSAGQPRVVYLTDEAARSGRLTTLVESSPETLVVVRPTMLRRTPPGSLDHDRVRLMPDEDSTPLLGTHFGIQRMLYDLLAAGAGTVVLDGVDFFLGRDLYTPGYVVRRTAAPLLNFSHDYAYGFRYTQRLVGTGLVAPAERVSLLLEQDVGAYLEALELTHPDRPPAMAP